MFFQRYAILVRFRIRTLMLLMVVVAAWLAWNVHWIRGRHQFIAQQKAAYAERGGDPAFYPVGGRPAQAPWSLCLFSEPGFEVLQFDVSVGHYVAGKPFDDYPEVRQARRTAQRLFPEAKTIDIEITSTDRQ